MTLQQAVESVISASTGTPAQWVGEEVVGGGCINTTTAIEFADGRAFFLKQMTRKAPIPADLLIREWPTVLPEPPASLMDGGEVL